MRSTDSSAAERALLHDGGRPGQWGSLGCWDDDPPDYAGACEALLQRLVAAAGVQPGAQVLCVACGAGEELTWLLDHAGAAQVVGVERDAAMVHAAQQRLVARPACVRVGSGTQLLSLGLAPACFDAVLCVDAAYHLHPRDDFLAQAWALLRPGGRLAYTDLSLAQGHAPLLRAAAWLCGVPAASLLSEEAQRERLRQQGFEAVDVQDLSEAVLGGFQRFVSRRPRNSRRVAWTARLIGPCRAAGLGYVLLAGTKPSSRAATACAERTALSSSGTPASA